MFIPFGICTLYVEWQLAHVTSNPIGLSLGLSEIAKPTTAPSIPPKTAPLTLSLVNAVPISIPAILVSKTVGNI